MAQTAEERAVLARTRRCRSQPRLLTRRQVPGLFGTGPRDRALGCTSPERGFVRSANRARTRCRWSPIRRDGKHVAVGEVSGNPQEITLVDPATGEVRLSARRSRHRCQCAGVFARWPDAGDRGRRSHDQILEFERRKRNEPRSTKASAAYARFHSHLTETGSPTLEVISRSRFGICRGPRHCSSAGARSRRREPRSSEPFINDPRRVL